MYVPSNQDEINLLNDLDNAYGNLGNLGKQAIAQYRVAIRIPRRERNGRRVTRC